MSAQGYFYWDPIGEFGVYGDSKEHVDAHLNAGYETVYKGTCTGGHLELKHRCSSAIYHRHYCQNPLVPMDGYDWPQGTGHRINEDGEWTGHVNDLWLDFLDKDPDLSFHPN